MVTDQSHKTSIIKVLRANFLLSIICSIVGIFVMVNGQIRYSWGIFFCRSLSDWFGVIPNFIDLSLAEKIFRAVEVRTITAFDSMVMMEVSVLCNVTIASPGNFNSVEHPMFVVRGTYLLKLQPFIEPLKQAGHLCWRSWTQCINNGWLNVGMLARSWIPLVDTRLPDTELASTQWCELLMSSETNFRFHLTHCHTT